MEDSAQLSSRRVYSGRILNLDIDRVRFPDGSQGELEIIRHPGASAVVALRDEPAAVDPQVVLIQQYRYAAGGPVYEIPAGRLNAGEAPVECARRELEEEAGYRAATMEQLVSILTTPGFTDERIHLFVAWGLTRGEQHHDRDEFLSVVEMPLSRALELIARGEIPDAKTALALLFFSAFWRTRLSRKV